MIRHSLLLSALTVGLILTPSLFPFSAFALPEGPPPECPDCTEEYRDSRTGYSSEFETLNREL